MTILLDFSRATRFHQSRNHSPGSAQSSALTDLRSLRNSDGKGILGCVFFIVLISIAIVLAIGLGPLYYSHSKFESAVEAEVSRAASQSMNNEAIADAILALAAGNKIQLAREDILIERSAGMVHIDVNYSVPVSFVFFRRKMGFQIKASSFVGTP